MRTVRNRIRSRRKRKSKRTGTRGGTHERYLALDCEMIEGPKRRALLAEVAIVDWDGNVVYHAYVRPGQPVTDYRTAISGITPEMLTAAAGAKSFAAVQRDVSALLRGAVLIGHALENDLRILGIQHPPTQIRNTAHHPYFQTMGPRGHLQPQKLATLYSRYVGNVEIQQGAHGAVEDARAAMRLYRTLHEEWDTPAIHEGPLRESIYRPFGSHVS